MNEIRIGTSGWNYAHWKGPFYPERFAAAKMLPFYAERFDTVELNTTFYGTPRRTSSQAWHDVTAPGFLFAVKMSRYVTHYGKLDAPKSLAIFFDAIEPLAEKAGPILVQLPPGWKKDTARLATFLDALPSGFRYTFELRNPTWFAPEVYELLEKHDAALCVYQLAGYQSPIKRTASWTYIRLHGPTKRKYQGRYGKAGLRPWAKLLLEWDVPSFVYFDNDDSGYAVEDALDLKTMLTAGSSGRGGR